MLKDDLQVVRIEAARSLLDPSAARLPRELAGSARAAFGEHWQSLLATADFPEAQMAIAGTALTLRQFATAESAFQEAVRLDPQLVDAWIMIARLRAAQGDSAGAEAAARTGLGFNPKSIALIEVLRAIGGSEEIE